MKDELKKWARKQAGELREIGKEASWTARKLYSDYKAKSEPPVRPQRPAARPQRPAQSPRQELTERMDREIHRAYYREGGVRFFACGLRRYAAVAMEREQDIQMVWAGAYNTNLRPMLRQVEKLEQTLEDLRTQFACEPLDLKNVQLLECMRTFAQRVRTDRLDQESDWQTEAYREAVRNYAADLSEQLLEVYYPPEDE